VGPAELPSRKQIKDLTRSETVGHSDVFRCLSHRGVSNDSVQRVLVSKFEPLEHSVYLGRERLGRYSRIGQERYAAFDARDRLLGEFRRRKDAYAAVANASCTAAGNRSSAKGARK